MRVGFFSPSPPRAMALPLNAWRTQPVHRNYRASSAASLRANHGFGGAPRAPPSQRHLQRRASQFRPLKRRRSPLQGKLRNKGMLAAAGTLPIMAGLGALIGGLVNKKKKTQEGSGGWPPTRQPTNPSRSTWWAGMGRPGGEKSIGPVTSKYVP